MLPFNEFPKIARLKRTVVITEKLDGTNAQINIRPADGNFELGYDVQSEFEGQSVYMRAGSRNRWLKPDDDNFGFWAWFYQNAPELSKLGLGAHFGEWWGSGIQRRYGLSEKRFSLFNTARWTEERPACCHVVPIIYMGPLLSAVDGALDQLRTDGSFAAPGFMKPEGVVIYHSSSRSLFKVTLEKDEEPKSKAA